MSADTMSSSLKGSIASRTSLLEQSPRTSRPMVGSASRTGKLIEVRLGSGEPRVSDCVGGRAHEIGLEGSDEPDVEEAGPRGLACSFE